MSVAGGCWKEWLWCVAKACCGIWGFGLWGRQTGRWMV